MKDKFSNILKNIFGMLLFYLIVCLLGYLTYYITFDNRELTFKNFLGMYAILLQIVILVTASMKNNDK
tara:strand:+ start:11790 stop:11993 length:204 start_codon:yes stop_codon:yes gene_type:complete